jgi:hypothetical protein
MCAVLIPFSCMLPQMPTRFPLSNAPNKKSLLFSSAIILSNFSAAETT